MIKYGQSIFEAKRLLFEANGLLFEAIRLIFEAILFFSQKFQKIFGNF
jgi:hypothetical protein